MVGIYLRKPYFCQYFSDNQHRMNTLASYPSAKVFILKTLHTSQGVGVGPY